MSSVNSDSINRNQSQEAYYFEGVEKVLEMWFHVPEDAGAARSFRDIPEEHWCQVLERLGAKILSKCCSVHWDSYVLSESSLFVSDTKIILKTCGSTTLLLALDHLLHVIKTNISHDAQISKLFYNRKSMLRPQSQCFPHKDINEENVFLKERFPSGHFKVVNFKQDDDSSIESNDFWAYFIYENGVAVECPEKQPIIDCTFEVMMSNLSLDKCAIFFKRPNGARALLHSSQGSSSTTGSNSNNNNNNNIVCDLSPQQSVSRNGSPRKTMSDAAGIFNIFPKCTLDDVEFEPCGYSMNGLFKQYYQTIHVTPEPAFSYASYETNQEMDDSLDSCVKAVEAFKPNEFVFTGFVPVEKGVTFIDSFSKKLSARLMSRFRLVHSQVDCSESSSVFIGCAKFERI